jgi:hypothetical protein
MNVTNLNCVHCHEALEKVVMDELSSWRGSTLWVCMNDYCSYHKASYHTMKEKNGVMMGYRYALGENGSEMPLLVLNKYSYKDRVVDCMQCEKETEAPEKKIDTNNYLSERLDTVERKLDQILMMFKSNPNLITK